MFANFCSHACEKKYEARRRWVGRQPRAHRARALRRAVRLPQSARRLDVAVLVPALGRDVVARVVEQDALRLARPAGRHGRRLDQRLAEVARAHVRADRRAKQLDRALHAVQQARRADARAVAVRPQRVVVGDRGLRRSLRPRLRLRHGLGADERLRRLVLRRLLWRYFRSHPGTVWRALPLPIIILAQWPFWAMENHNAKRRARFDPGNRALRAFNDGIGYGAFMSHVAVKVGQI